MNLPTAVKDAVIEDFVQSLTPFNQVQSVERKLNFLTGKDGSSSNTLSELENFINDHLSADLSSADVEMDLFLARKKFIEKAFSYFQGKIVAEKLSEQCRELCQDKLEPHSSTYNIDPKERQVDFSYLFNINTSVLFNEMNNEEIPPFMLTRQQAELLKQGVVDKTGSLCENLGKLLDVEISANNKGELSQSRRRIDLCIKESYAVYENTKAQSTNAFYQSLYTLAQIFKDLKDLLQQWNKEAISSFDLKIFKIKRLCLQVENCFFKLKLLREKVLVDIYDTNSRRKLSQNKEYLNIKYNKLLSEHDKIQSALEKYMRNRDEMDSIALEYRKTVQAIHEREEEIKCLRRLHIRSQS
ncbi:uncharacterized protein Gasu_15440 [Galdieria sulphuraria]|uniref:HAUS augmin-like complex subunit 4 n=1 Tax=Galdieria sulphuraria TaxID=130081 RepID=M2X4F4_GALSU|nr:uncharacterized protein Gasu_15440 [Galdieria sulphuraria]EME31310.1 hypothetical protein Gasu_15440 [Galdieria sulphuraria]|eukprot:XP_005707830.1 hypothetical protein Gasu_15440 [Galdieria sulphuraria]